MLRLFRSKIQIKLILVFIVVFGLALTASTSVLLVSIKRLGLSSIQRQLDEEKMIISQRLVDMEAGLLKTASLVSQQPHVIEHVLANDINRLELSIGIAVTSLGHDVLWILDGNGQIIAHHSNLDEPVTDGNIVIDSSLLQDSPLSGMNVINETSMLLGSAPIYTAEHELAGFVVVGNAINGHMLSKINFYRDSLALVIFTDRANMAGVSANEANNLPHLAAHEVEVLRLHDLQLAQVQNGESLRMFDVIVRETLHAIVYMPFEINGVYQGYYAIAVDENEPRTIQATVLVISLITIIVVLGLIGSLAVLSTWHIVLRPLELLSKVTSEFGRGQTNIRISSASTDEIGQLYATFNTMAERIDLRTQELQTLNSQLETRVHERTVQIERQTQWLETIVCQAKEAIIVTRADGKIEIINAMALSIMSLKEAEISGLSLIELLQKAAGHLVSLPEKNSQVHGELEIKNHFYQYSIASIQTGSLDATSGYVCVLTDITTLRRLSALQSQVIRIAAHDLRSPITALGLQFRLLQQNSETLTVNQNTILDRMQMTVSDMRGMITDLLNVERIEQQASGMSETVVLGSLISSVLAMLEPQFTQKQQKVSVEIEDNLPLLCGDPIRLLEVLRNLLTNAYKYTPYGGEIVLRVYVNDKGLRVDVSDSGIGIDEDDIQHIFEGNFRAKTALHSGSEGLGVGLSLVKEIIHEHDGKISVTSQKGSGSTFSFYLPIA